ALYIKPRAGAAGRMPRISCWKAWCVSAPRKLIRPSARLKLALCVTLLGVGLAGCDLFGGKDDETNNANKDAANYRERSVEQIYADGWRAIGGGNWELCAAQFNEVERQH